MLYAQCSYKPLWRLYKQTFPMVIMLYAVNHALDAEERINGGCCGKPIHIGKNVWLGGDVKILVGVRIGDNTIIGTGSIVIKSIPPHVIAVGNPCKVIRKITEADKTAY